MKRLIASFLFAALPLSAEASTDLARQWGLEASRLSTATSELIYAVDMGQPVKVTDLYALDIHRFGRTSAELARWIDGSEGPRDLGCIFRGMATEANDQLSVLEADADVLERRESLRRLAGMFADAEIIAIAAQRRSPSTGRIASTVKSVCATDAETVLSHMR